MTDFSLFDLVMTVLEPDPTGVVVRPLANAIPTGSSPGRFPRCIPAAGAPIQETEE